MPQATGYLDHPPAYWAEMLKDKNPLIRRLAVYALGECGSAAGECVEELADALKDSENFVRVWAAAALAKVAPNRHAEVNTVLLANLSDNLSFVRSLAAWHLGRLGQGFAGTSTALPALEKLQEDADLSVRTETCRAIRRLRGKSVPSLAGTVCGVDW